MTTPIRYNDSPWKQKCHPYESGYRIIHYTCDSPYHGAPEITWNVRCPVTHRLLAQRESEESARAAAREIAERGIAE